MMDGGGGIKSKMNEGRTFSSLSLVCINIKIYFKPHYYYYSNSLPRLNAPRDGK